MANLGLILLSVYVGFIGVFFMYQSAVKANGKFGVPTRIGVALMFTPMIALPVIVLKGLM